jgi:phosphomannomutase
LSNLRENLNYGPRDLRFGTSGRRGRVVDLTQLETYISVAGELEFLQALPASEGGIRRGDEFFLAHDLRPSSIRFDTGQQDRGELCQAAIQAIRDAGLTPVNLGPLPTPALTYCALERKRGSLMVTGSHIPFDLNGYKLNRSTGELLKEHEGPINESVERVRARVYGEPFETSLFNERGMLRGGHCDLPPVSPEGRAAYLKRYQSFFAGQDLKGRRILVYQHSAVGRDLLGELLEHFGAEVVVRGRSDEFVAIDTEAIDQAQLSAIQALADEAGPLWAIVSTDGDSDRPLILGFENGQARFCGGDLVGMVVAEYLGADAVVVPVTCNDAIDRGSLASALEPKTRIGSPFVVAGMTAALAKGRKRVCGWEANGGFLLGSDIERHGRLLSALPTRDAFLPILGVLFCARSQGLELNEVFQRLPKRFSRAALLRNFPREDGKSLIAALSLMQPEQLAPFFSGFGKIARIDLTDGVRIYFANGDITHFRPSGNADEFRVYAVADTQQRANEIVDAGVAEPFGLIRSLARVFLKPPGKAAAGTIARPTTNE